MSAFAGIAAIPDGGTACVDAAIVSATNATPPASHILFSRASSPEIFSSPAGLVQPCLSPAFSTAESNFVSRFLFAAPVFHDNPPAHASAIDQMRCGKKYSLLSARLCGFRGNNSFNSNEVCIVTYAQRRENESFQCRSHRANIPANPLYSWVLVLMIEAIRH